MRQLILPGVDGTLVPFAIVNDPLPLPRDTPVFNRIVYAAAHVVADPLADNSPWLDTAIDWERTLAYRNYLWDLGFGVAEAMDTAQRGMGLDWQAARKLIAETARAAKSRGALVAYGAGTDHLPVGASIDEVIAAYEEQIDYVEGIGGRVILMASRALAAAARSPDDYLRVYDRLLHGAGSPVILHWLGDMFDPALAGYWGSAEIAPAMDTALAIIAAHPRKVDGIKISLLSKQHEIDMRRRLPAGVRMYSGDDFNYPELIAGDSEGHSHALLGIFDAIAPAAASALVSLAGGDEAGFYQAMNPTIALSRHIFAAPTRFYKTGIVFLAWLNGFQDHFTMLGGQQSARSLPHFARLLQLADAARVLRDPDLAAARMSQLMHVYGVK